jgi:hypothetical protein
MTFEEIPLYEAVHDVYRTVEGPRSDVWLVDPQDKERLCRLIQAHLPLDSPFTSRHMLQAWAAYGRSRTANEQGEKKLELLIQVARLFGKKCFYQGRGKGDCTAEATVERIVPGARGGAYVVENCVLACSYHNSQRGDRPLEDYLTPLKELAVRLTAMMDSESRP